jgi:hypothetical protein
MITNTRELQQDTITYDKHINVLEKDIVLVLNKSWIPIGITSVKKAIISMMGGENESPVYAVDVESDKNGNLTYANPVDWSLWKDLPIRKDDFYVQAAKYRVRAPTLLIAKNYNKIPIHRPRLSPSAIWERDGGTCQYSGKKLTRSTGNLDHIIPRDRGGRDEWTNLVLCDKKINSIKGNRLNHEVGLTLIRQPKAPSSVPVSASIKAAKHPTWIPFLIQ